VCSRSPGGCVFFQIRRLLSLAGLSLLSTGHLKGTTVPRNRCKTAEIDGEILRNGSPGDIDRELEIPASGSRERIPEVLALRHIFPGQELAFPFLLDEGRLNVPSTASSPFCASPGNLRSQSDGPLFCAKTALPPSTPLQPASCQSEWFYHTIPTR